MSLEETLKRLFTYEIRVNRQNRKRDRRNKTDPETTARLTARKFQKKMRKLNLFIPTLDNNPLLTAVFFRCFYWHETIDKDPIFRDTRIWIYQNYSGNNGEKYLRHIRISAIHIYVWIWSNKRSPHLCI